MNLTEHTALLLVDIQQGFDDIAYWGGARNNPGAEANAARLLEVWRLRGWPLFHIQHCSVNPASRLAPGHPGNAFKPEVRPEPGEPVIQKTVNSAFIGTGLKGQLEAAGIRQVLIAGLTTDHCVSTTTRMAGNYGFETILVADACATFDKTGHDGQRYPAQLVHDTALASLHGEFATVLGTDRLLQVLRDTIVKSTTP
ncbi:MAG: cysteine hydrolase [Chitinophagaceae bacterium]|nr:MAG: cysteine hydrolase [Chitinophagaceae bacterium]